MLNFILGALLLLAVITIFLILEKIKVDKLNKQIAEDIKSRVIEPLSPILGLSKQIEKDMYGISPPPSYGTLSINHGGPGESTRLVAGKAGQVGKFFSDGTFRWIDPPNKKSKKKSKKRKPPKKKK